MDTTLRNAIVIAILVFLVVIGIAYMIHRIFHKEIMRGLLLKNRIELSDIFVTIELIISTEKNLYEDFLISNGGNTDYASMTNTEFTNIYKEMSAQCLRAISPQLWDMAEIYMNRREIQTYITQQVYNYLAEKVPPA